MSNKFVELVTGSLEEKRAWKQQMKRVDALPADYRLACKNILQYGYHFGVCLITQTDLLELFEQSAADGRTVTEVVGSDVAAFCDELMRACEVRANDARETLNRDIAAHFGKEAQ